MTPTQFDKSVRLFFEPVLHKHAFSLDGSRHCTFQRKASDEVYHFIVPDLGRRGAWYDVKVFPASPQLDPLFAERFPDDIGIPTDSWSYLSERGVGLNQEQFNCKSAENFANRFEKTVRQLLSAAVDYLNQFQTVESMIPVIKSPLSLGIALHHVGRIEEARPVLKQQQERLSATGSSDRVVTAWLERISELLG